LIVTDAFSYSDAVLPVTCDVHNGKALEYYCEIDQVTVCSECALLGDHKGHPVVGCEEKVGQLFHHASLFSRARTDLGTDSGSGPIRVNRIGPGPVKNRSPIWR